MSVRLITGDCREVLKTLPDESVHCVVTSPPYLGLRDYGTAKWEGGDEACDHSTARSRGDDIRTGDKQGTSAGSRPNTQRECPCGARRIDSQIGLEPTPDAYVAELVAVFREVRRVLRRDGTFWCNLGDSYAQSETRHRQGKEGSTLRNGAIKADEPWANGTAQTGRKQDHGLKPKDLIGIPWRVAFALQADGWWLRQDIIWSKPNPMPESVTDRCTKAHEYLFLLTRSATYWYDAEAIKESVDSTVRVERTEGNGLNTIERSLPTGKARSLGVNPDGRNKRSVWTVPSAPFSEAHFATFPPALIEPCIKAGCPERACAKCGAPWVRETERIDTCRRQKMADGWYTGPGGHGTIHRNGREHGAANTVFANVTVGFSPSCACAADTAPGICLDPFGGAGTTGLVADRLGRNAILIELNPAYAEMGRTRIVDDGPLFAQVTP